MIAKVLVGRNRYLINICMLLGICNMEFSRAKEGIILKGQCRQLYVHSVSEWNGSSSAPWWSIASFGSGACFICNSENSLNSWFYTKFSKYNDFKLIHVDIDLQVTECSDCKNQYLNVYVVFEDLITVTNENILIQKLRRLPLVGKLVPKRFNQREQHHIQFVTKSDAQGFSLVFRSNGGCIIVFKMTAKSFHNGEETKAIEFDEEQGCTGC